MLKKNHTQSHSTIVQMTSSMLYNLDAKSIFKLSRVQSAQLIALKCVKRVVGMNSEREKENNEDSECPETPSNILILIKKKYIIEKGHRCSLLSSQSISLVYISFFCQCHTRNDCNDLSVLSFAMCPKLYFEVMQQHKETELHTAHKHVI